MCVGCSMLEEALDRFWARSAAAMLKAWVAKASRLGHKSSLLRIHLSIDKKSFILGIERPSHKRLRAEIGREDPQSVEILTEKPSRSKLSPFKHAADLRRNTVLNCFNFTVIIASLIVGDAFSPPRVLEWIDLTSLPFLSNPRIQNCRSVNFVFDISIQTTQTRCPTHSESERVRATCSPRNSGNTAPST